MFAHIASVLTIASTLAAQTPIPDAQAALAATQNGPAVITQSQNAGQNAPAAQTITLPAGTTIALTLMSVIKSKSTKPGDAVRAVVAFPVTEGSQLAIPAGAYAEGVVSQVTSRPMSNQQPTFRVHFTRLVFSNGYSVALNGENTQALVIPADSSAPANELAELMPLRTPGENFAMGGGQSTPTMPTLPPLPQVGPPKGLVIGLGLGAMAAFAIGMFAWMHHRVNTYDYVLFDAGWQFQLVLDSPVTLDAAQVAAAAAIPSAN